MIDFAKYKAVTFDCYGTLIDWETGITDVVRPWLTAAGSPIPVDLVITSFALMQAKHQQARPALLYSELLRRTWRDIEETFGWDHDREHANAFADAVGAWPPFNDTIDSLKYLARFYKLVILSNVDNASLARTLRILQAPFALTVTAEDVGSYKPATPHFEAAMTKLAQIGIQRAEILHVAQSKHHDINPGRRLGLTTVWVNRRSGKKGTGATLAAEAVPDLTVTSLADLVDAHRTQSKTSAA